nr:hypothetical protein [Acidobacteriota bacterium]
QTPNTPISAVIIQVWGLFQIQTVLLGGLFTLLPAFGLDVYILPRLLGLRREQTPNTPISAVITQVWGLFQIQTVLLGGLFTLLQLMPRFWSASFLKRSMRLRASWV